MCVSMGYYVDCGMSRPVADTIHHMLRYEMSLWSVSGCATAGDSQACGPRAPQNPTHATHSLQFTMARASWTAIACPRARARDERVATGDSRIGWGGCGPNRVRVSQNPVVHTVTATYGIGWGGCGPKCVRLLRGRVVHTVTARDVPNRLKDRWVSGVRVGRPLPWNVHHRL